MSALSYEHKVLLTLATDIGAELLCSGAEAWRVEDTMTRILTSLGAVQVDIFTITSSIVATARWDEVPETQTRRIRSISYDMSRLIALNELSRQICSGACPIDEIRDRLNSVNKTPVYSSAAQMGIYALTSSSFTLFFGGTPVDAVLSALIGILLYSIVQKLSYIRIQGILASFMIAVLGGLFSQLALKFGIGCSPDKIAIGDIMLFIPGIALTNSIRDMFTGDTISGLLRFCESILLSLTLAFGFALPSLLF